MKTREEKDAQNEKRETGSTPASSFFFVPLRAPSWTILFALALFALASTVGCRKSDMGEQPRYKPYQATASFEDGASARPLVAGTIPWHQPRTDELLYQGTIDGKVADEFPFPITANDLKRGQQQFNIYCSVCHGQTGEGNGMIAQRGLTPPPSYHIDRLRSAPVGHFFYVMTNGFGAMYSYAERVKPEDRWRIAAYIRALQLSQNFDPAKLSADEKAKADDLEAKEKADNKPGYVEPKELEGNTGPRAKVGVDQ
jgi:mono/diheme cytochrome c family protein